MDKPLRLKLKKCYHLARPAHVVNACFIAVLFFSTLLIWREINVLEEAYVANQRNNLANVAHEMDGLLQFNIDRMMFFRHGMQAALEQPLDIDVLRKASQRYLSLAGGATESAYAAGVWHLRQRRWPQPYPAGGRSAGG